MQKDKLLIVGHRGAAGHSPENTMAGFRKAIEFGVDMVELDVHLTNDGVVVVHHDNSLDRTTSGKGEIKAINGIISINLMPAHHSLDILKTNRFRHLKM